MGFPKVFFLIPVFSGHRLPIKWHSLSRLLRQYFFQRDHMLSRDPARFLQLEDQVVFTGRIPHDDVQRYYSLIDIAPLPRKGLRVCELVSPLKPFEAMGAGKVLITSSVQALSEIVQDGVTGMVFEKDNSEDLAAKLETAILDEELRKNIGGNANKWVIENHSWDVISQRVTSLYDKIMEAKQ